ncbi:MAG: alpha/beta hydrolase, partial [Acidobacteriota bacterium]
MKITILLAIIFFVCGPVVFGQDGSVGIDSTRSINIGGIKQVVQIKGRDVTKPILLYLHGAGGNKYSLIANADKLTSNLQEHFVVVLWD